MTLQGMNISVLTWTVKSSDRHLCSSETAQPSFLLSGMGLGLASGSGLGLIIGMNQDSWEIPMGLRRTNTWRGSRYSPWPHTGSDYRS